MSSKVEVVCANPSCSKTGTLICSGCADVHYCSKECQKTHWTEHKKTCKSKTGPRTIEKLKESELRSVLIEKAETFDNKVKKNTLLNKAENPEEKVEVLRKLAKEHVQDSEINELLARSDAKLKKKEERLSSTATKHTGGKKIKPPTNFAQGAPSPEQMMQQAAFMRKNPDAVRKAQPAFANLTDEQIKSYADQLEATAKDPDMLKEVERMAKLGDGDKKLLQTIQQGLSGVTPIDEAWIDEIVNAIKTKPELFKTMFGGKGAMMGGMSDDQVNSYIDMASGMSTTFLKFIAYGIWYMSKAAKPLGELYKTIDTYTFGSARYLAFGLFALVMYYISMFVFFIIRIVVGQLYALYLVVSGSKAAAVTAGVASKVASEVVNNAAGAAAGSDSEEF